MTRLLELLRVGISPVSLSHDGFLPFHTDVSAHYAYCVCVCVCVLCIVSCLKKADPTRWPIDHLTSAHMGCDGDGLTCNQQTNQHPCSRSGLARSGGHKCVDGACVCTVAVSELWLNGTYCVSLTITSSQAVRHEARQEAKSSIQKTCC